MESIKKKEFNFYSFEYEQKKDIENILLEFLKFMKKEEFYNHLLYIVDELITNAEKSNMKRIFFEEEKLNINDNHDYCLGIKHFKENVIRNYQDYRNKLKTSGFYINFEISIDENNFYIRITNNNPILPVELARINELIKTATVFNSIEDVFLRKIEESESGGFGIIIIILMLRQIGFYEKNFQVIKSDNNTISEIAIPTSMMNNREIEMLSSDVAKEINEIPQFPNHINELMSLLNQSESNFEMLSDKIKKDPSLIADLIKTANSPIYAVPQTVDNIEEAVRIIGYNNLKNLIIGYATNMVFVNRYNMNKLKDIINHSKEVAFFAVEIAKFFKYKDIVEQVYICGMLHDFGKIIIKSIKPDITDRIYNLCKSRGLNVFTMESLTNGYNHSVIGYELSKKWNFPYFMQEAMHYHHIPLESSDESNLIVSIVYFADRLYYLKRNEFGFENFYQKVLKTFNLDNKKDFENFCQLMILKCEKYL